MSYCVKYDIYTAWINTEMVKVYIKVHFEPPLCCAILKYYNSTDKKNGNVKS